MKIIYPINIHLDRREPCPILDAVQGENGRAVAVSLFEKGQPWNIPAGAYALIRYARPDACGGIYDTLPGGAPACGIQGNTVTAQLTAQALAVAGMVSVQLAIVYEEVQLATFIFLVRVESDPSAGTAAAEEYVNLLPQLIQDAKNTADAAEQAALSAKQAAASLDASFELVGQAQTQSYIAQQKATLAAQSAATAESAAKRAEDAAASIDGNVGQSEYLRMTKRKLQGYDLLAQYNGKEGIDAQLPLAFSCIEPSSSNGQSDILKHHLPDMPAMLFGTFKATEDDREEYHFDFAYAFSGGYINSSQTACVVIDPAAAKVWHFDFSDDGYSVKESAIGESSNGMAQTEAEKIVAYTVSADAANATKFAFTVSDYPKLAQYNHLRGIYKTPTNVSWPWTQIFVNNTVIAKQSGNSTSMALFDILKQGEFFDGSISAYTNPSNYNAWTKDNQAFRSSMGSLLPKNLGDLASVAVGSYQAFLPEGSTIEIWGWNE